MNQAKFHWHPDFNSLIIFAVSMGFLEAIVVVYIRELYYPEGFAFPLKPLPEWFIGIEMVRELCTLFMLGAVAFITGKVIIRRLAAFLFIFGVWDIVFYIALWLFLDWPPSLLTWDILFLIPVAWTAPVLAPVLCSLTMIALAGIMEWKHQNTGLTKPGTIAMVLFGAGAMAILFTFIFDFGRIIIQGNYLPQFFSLADNQDFLNEMVIYTPKRFQWEIFFTGLLLILAGIFPLVKRL